MSEEKSIGSILRGYEQMSDFMVQSVSGQINQAEAAQLPLPSFTMQQYIAKQIESHQLAISRLINFRETLTKDQLNTDRDEFISNFYI
jgi:hypothetical protein